MKFILILLPFLLAFGPFDSPKGLVEDGNLSYETENFDEALGSYNRALKVTKDASAIEYNRANTLIKKGEMEEALNSYEKAASTGNNSLKQKAYYNMGNALYRSEKFKEAASAYKEALKANPQDEDAKTNLEMTLQKIQQQKQDPDKNNDDKKGDDKNKDKNKDRNKDKDKKKDGEEEDKKPDNGDSQEDSDKQKDKEGEQQDKGDDEQKEQSEKDADKDAGKKESDMSKTDAERLRDSLGDRNIDLQTMKDMLKGERPAKTEKDW